MAESSRDLRATRWAGGGKETKTGVPQSEIIDASERRFNLVAPNRNRGISSNSDIGRLRTEMAAPNGLCSSPFCCVWAER